MTTPERIQRLIDGRQMERIDPDLESIETHWMKALASSADSRKGLYPDNAVTLGYQAALLAATAVLESAGYRTRGASPGHHYNTFYALAGLRLPRLEDVDVASERIRKLRTGAVYGARSSTTADVDAVHRWLDELLPSTWSAISVLRSDLASRLPRP